MANSFFMTRSCYKRKGDICCELPTTFNKRSLKELAAGHIGISPSGVGLLLSKAPLKQSRSISSKRSNQPREPSNNWTNSLHVFSGGQQMSEGGLTGSAGIKCVYLRPKEASGYKNLGKSFELSTSNYGGILGNRTLGQNFWGQNTTGTHRLLQQESLVEIARPGEDSQRLGHRCSHISDG